MKRSFVGSRYFALSLLLLTTSGFVVAKSPKRQQIVTNKLSTDSHCRIIHQKDLPFTVKESGIYRLGQDLTYTGAGAAITIADIHDVRLEFDAYALTLTNKAATGILIRNAWAVTVENDSITNTSTAAQTGNGITIVNGNKITLKNLLLKNHANGLLITDSQNVLVQGSEIWNASVAGAQVVGSTDVVFEKDVFTDNTIGLLFASSGKANQDCSVVGSSFPNSSGKTNLLAQQVNGLTIEESSFSNTGTSAETTTLAQLGDTGATQLCNDVVVRNSSFINRSTNYKVEGLNLFHGVGFLVDSILVDINNTGQLRDTHFAGIHISNLAAGTTFTKGIVSNSVFQGPSINGIYQDKGTDAVVVENALVTGALSDAIVLSGTTNSTIKDSVITNNAGYGIFIADASTFNAILNNVISQNAIGVQVDALSININNTIQYNQIFGNAVHGVQVFRDGNHIFYNTAYNNFNIGFFPAGSAVVNHPGDPTTAGANLDVPNPPIAG